MHLCVCMCICVRVRVVCACGRANVCECVSAGVVCVCVCRCKCVCSMCIKVTFAAEASVRLLICCFVYSSCGVTSKRGEILLLSQPDICTPLESKDSPITREYQGGCQLCTVTSTMTWCHGRCDRKRGGYGWTLKRIHGRCRVSKDDHQVLSVGTPGGKLGRAQW